MIGRKYASRPSVAGVNTSLRIRTTQQTLLVGSLVVDSLKKFENFFGSTCIHMLGVTANTLRSMNCRYNVHHIINKKNLFSGSELYLY